MNYWQRWIGDWKRKTAHLSAEAKGIYGELLDHQYATHRPLPLELDEVYRIAGAWTPAERKATDRVLQEFFTKSETGYSNARAEEEIARHTEYSEGQRERAHMRWKKEEERTHRSKGNGEAEPQPELPEWIAAQPWRDWIKTRPARARTPAAQIAAITKLTRFREQGHDPNAIVAESLSNGWQGLFAPDAKRSQKLSLAEANRAAAAEASRRFHEEKKNGHE